MPMEKEKFDKVNAIAREIVSLERMIKKFPTGIVVDWANDYSTGRARPITLIGIADCSYLHKRLEVYKRTLDKQMDIIEQAIEQHPDSTTRDIMRMKYIEGLTNREIAIISGYSEQAIKWRQRRFFTKD